MSKRGKMGKAESGMRQGHGIHSRHGAATVRERWLGMAEVEDQEIEIAQTSPRCLERRLSSA